MKNTIMNLKNKATYMVASVKKTISNNTAEGYIDTGVKIIIGVVIGGVILAGLYTLFSGIVDTTLPAKINELFNYGA